MVYYVVVNVPFFVIRLIVWHLHDKHVSVFIVKNVLGIGLAVQHLHEFLVEVLQVMKADLATGADAGTTAATAAAGDTATTEMRKLTTETESEGNKPAETSEVPLTDIRS